MSGKTFKVLYFVCPLSLGWDSGYSHIKKKKQSIENLRYLKGPVCGICIRYLAVTAELGVLSHDGVVLRLWRVLLCMKGTLH